MEPTVPDARRFLEVSAGSVTLHLNAWQDGGCPMIYFVVEYKPKKQKEWTLVSNNVKPGGNFVVLDLAPATWYNLKVHRPLSHLKLSIFKTVCLRFLFVDPPDFLFKHKRWMTCPPGDCPQQRWILDCRI